MLGLSLDNFKLVIEIISLDNLKLITKSRGIKWKSLLSALSNPKIDNKRLKKIMKDLNRSKHKFLKLEIKEIRKSFYEIESKKK